MTVKLENLSKSYQKKVIFDGVNLVVPTGSFTVLSGRSGSGKSTLLNIIGGIEPLTSGKVLIDEQDVSKLKGKAKTDFYRHQVGFIFQGFYLQPQLTISENISLMGIFAGMKKTERAARASELARILGIEEVLDRTPSEISGGQAQRVCAARALFMRPKIILADEPTNNLDSENAKNVIEMLKQIQLSMGTTMIVASHDQMVLAYATQIVRVADGKVNSSENNGNVNIKLQHRLKNNHKDY